MIEIQVRPERSRRPVKDISERMASRVLGKGDFKNLSHLLSHQRECFGKAASRASAATAPLLTENFSAFFLQQSHYSVIMTAGMLLVRKNCQQNSIGTAFENALVNLKMKSKKIQIKN